MCMVTWPLRRNKAVKLNLSDTNLNAFYMKIMLPYFFHIYMKNTVKVCIETKSTSHFYSKIMRALKDTTIKWTISECSIFILFNLSFLRL